MARKSVFDGVGGGQTYESLKLEIEAFETELEPREQYNKHHFTEREDAILLALWESPKYQKQDIAKKLGLSRGTCRRRYKELCARQSID